MSGKTFVQLVTEVLYAKRYEPKPRNHDGWRHHGHRFPIKGGISLLEVNNRIAREAKCALFERLNG